MGDVRSIIHADMDAFYASVEQRDDPKLRGRPVVVGGSSTRGVVSAASYEARAFGIHSAMPTVQARKLCPHAVFVPGRMSVYRRESRRIFEIFGRFTPAVEGISLDEAFLDLSGTERLFGPPERTAMRLRESVRAETGLAVSVGLAPVKLVAKIASDLAKPDGLLVVPPGRVPEFLAPLPVGRIWGVGPVTRARLERAGIHTIGELGRRHDRELLELLGSFGPAAARLARGDDAREVEPYREAKSYSEENTFEHDVRVTSQIEHAIRAHADAVARRLRHDGLQARGVRLKLKLARSLGQGRFPILTRSQTLREPSDDGEALADAGCALLARAALEEPIRLVGLAAERLEAAGSEQLSLLAETRTARERRSRLNRALDEIRARFGPRALERAESEVTRAGLSFQIKRGEDLDLED
ncbi:MAG TPA: DNA polymerase IV [Myxococcota bacterium]|nr:DNA polymerase IV [Myxococcota bacterium]